MVQIVNTFNGHWYGRCVEAESWRVVVSSSDGSTSHGSTDEEGDRRRIRTKNKRRDKRKKLGAWWLVCT